MQRIQNQNKKYKLLKSSLILIYEVSNARMYKGKWTENARNGT